MEKTVSGSSNANTGKDSFRNTAQSSGSYSSDMKGSMNDVKSAIVDQAGPAMDFLKDNLSAIGEKTQVYAKDAGAWVRRYPLYSILGAAAIGAFLGMAIARPSASERSSS